MTDEPVASPNIRVRWKRDTPATPATASKSIASAKCVSMNQTAFATGINTALRITLAGQSSTTCRWRLIAFALGRTLRGMIEPRTIQTQAAVARHYDEL